MSSWIILRTSGGQTRPLAKSLHEAGFEAWSPGRTLRRYMPAKTPSGTRLIETDVAILPTFVFAPALHIDELLAVSAQRSSTHPSFSVFHHAGRVPFVADCSIQGLRDEESREAAKIAAMHAAESRAAAESIRIAAIKSAASRRRAEHELERDRRLELRRSPIEIDTGVEVEVIDMPALVGVRGVFERADGPYAHVRFGSRSWKIEGWRILPAANNDNSALRSTAA